MRLIRLAYASQLAPRTIDRDVDALVATAIVRNSASGITGCLSVDNDGNVVQILEGEESEVSALFDKIEKDPRHEAVVELVRQDIDRLTFGGWGMKRWPIADLAALIVYR